MEKLNTSPESQMTELGSFETIEELSKAIIIQFKNHLLTNKEIYDFFVKSGEKVSMEFIKSVKID
jgi:hypothetical protein